MKKYLQLIIPSVLIISFSGNLNGQNSKEKLLEKISNYKVLNKEIAYLHLNKSLLLKGEQLGFTAYVLNESTHKPDFSNSNLYVTVRNEKDSLIKKEMYLIEDGTTSGIIDIDSTFIAGNYTITAFTGYMKNFEEPYYFSENFTVLNSNSISKKPQSFPDKIDISFLPEGGHFLNNTINNVGVIATDSLGRGLGNGKILIKNENKELVNIINLNKFGIGKFSFLPNRNKSYTAVLEYMEKEVPVDFAPKIHSKGLILSVSQKDSQLEVLIKTNARSLPLYKSEEFFLVAQNNENFYSFDIAFEDFTTALVVFNLNEIDPGMNIFTLFNEKMQPIAERLYFNHQNFNVEISREISTTAKKDSMEISLPFEAEKEGKVSVLILPQNTISYQRNHNILSYIHLKPYIKGNIENAAWYFTNINPEKKVALDNLLLTRGWSSYNWSKIINETTAPVKIEDRFSFKAEIPSKKAKKENLRYMIHGVGPNLPQVVEIPEGINSFVFDEYYPVNDQKLKISRIKPNENLVPAKLDIQFQPANFPDFNIPQAPIIPINYYSTADQTQKLFNYEGLNADAELLDEVHLSGKNERPIDRARKLGNPVWGRVVVVSKRDVNSFSYLSDLLKAENLGVNNSPDFTVTTNLSLSSNFIHSENTDGPKKVGDGRTMLLYLDDFPMINTSVFYNFPIQQVDYVEINKGGMGEGFMGANGTIKVYTKRGSHFSSKPINRIQEFTIPVAYAKEKEYYFPKYENTSDEFFQNYGVIDWKPEVRFEKGKAEVINIKKPEVDFQLIIEGVTSDGDLIHNIQQLSPNQNNN